MYKKTISAKTVSYIYWYDSGSINFYVSTDLDDRFFF